MRIDEVTNGDTHTLGRLYSFIQKNCQPYLKQCPKFDHLLFRGSRLNGQTVIITRDPNRIRNPRDTPEYLHNKFNETFSKLGFMANRNSLFTTGDIGSADVYASGLSSSIFPIGEFKFTWSPTINDLYTISTYARMYNIGAIKLRGKSRYAEQNENVEDFSHLGPRFISTVFDFLRHFEIIFVEGKFEQWINDVYKNETNSTLMEAIQSNNEIMVSCKRYLSVSREQTKGLLQFQKEV